MTSIMTRFDWDEDTVEIRRGKKKHLRGQHDQRTHGRGSNPKNIGKLVPRMDAAERRRIENWGVDQIQSRVHNAPWNISASWQGTIEMTKEERMPHAPKSAAELDEIIEQGGIEVYRGFGIKEISRPLSTTDLDSPYRPSNPGLEDFIAGEGDHFGNGIWGAGMYTAAGPLARKVAGSFGGEEIEMRPLERGNREYAGGVNNISLEPPNYRSGTINRMVVDPKAKIAHWDDVIEIRDAHWATATAAGVGDAESQIKGSPAAIAKALGYDAIYAPQSEANIGIDADQLIILNRSVLHPEDKVIDSTGAVHANITPDRKVEWKGIPQSKVPQWADVN